MTETQIKSQEKRYVKKARPLTIKIKYLLLVRKLTVRELARRIARRYRRKVDPTAVSKVIQGQRFTPYIQQGIAKELGVPFEEIFQVGDGDANADG